MATKKPVLTLLSKSGGGKDTQAEILVSKHGFFMINSGALLRGLKNLLPKLRKGSVERYEAEKVQEIINSGLFVPALTIMCQWRLSLLEIVMNPKKVNGIVFTGSPRKMAEAMLIHEFFKNWPDANKHFRLVPIEIKISDKEASKRLLLRRQCADCKKIFTGSKEHLALTVCDECEGKLIRRKDDSPSGIRSRLTEFKEHTIPVIKYFKKEGLLKSVDGEKTTEDVYQQIAKILKL